MKFITNIKLLLKGIIVVLIIIISLNDNIFASGDIAEELHGNVVIFATPQTSSSLIALTDESVKYLKRVLNRLGRFRPVEDNRLKWAVTLVRERGGDEKDFYKRVSTALKVDIFVLISIYQVGKAIFAEMRVVPLESDFQSLRKIIRVRSKILKNITLKLGRELVYLHEQLPLRAKVIDKSSKRLYHLNIGQWDGVIKGRRYNIEGGYLVIYEIGRYQSLAEICGKQRDVGDAILIHSYPEIDEMIDEIDRRISRNTEYRYGLANTILKDDHPEKRMIEGICIINMGGNVCLPGYGAFLSTHYLGFKDASPDVTGIIVSSSLIAVHFTLPGFLTRFKINLLPWEKDRDKTDRMQNLQVFLWATLPATFSVAYMNQLAYQFNKTEHLPPFFSDRDAAASAFSLFIPGGGLFYKGYRFGGWCYYFSEMMLAGYGVYYYDSGRKGKYALTALGVIKLIELLNAYLIKPSYRFYRIEMERESRISLRIGTERFCDTENIYKLGITYRF